MLLVAKITQLLLEGYGETYLVRLQRSQVRLLLLIISQISKQRVLLKF